MRLYRLRRRPFGFWLITFLLAGLTAAAVLRVEARAARWGSLSSVVVAGRAVPAGAVLALGDVRVERWPRHLVPDGAAADAVGQATTVDLSPGEPVLRRRLAPDGVVGLAARVPPGLRAVALPVDGPALAVRIGDAVDVLATFESEPTVVVIESAQVVDVAEADGGRAGRAITSVTVAVSPDDTPRLAYALTHSTLTLVLSTFSTRAPLVEKVGGDR